MKSIISFLLSAAFCVAMTPVAHAHLGHLGELAGHAHWIGLGGVVVAGALGLALGLKPVSPGKEQDARGEEAQQDETSQEEVV